MNGGQQPRRSRYDGEAIPSFPWAALIALSTVGFAIGSSEFVMMGLLPQIMAEFAISLPRAGHTISAYAIGVMVGAPTLAIFGTALPPRRLLIGLALLHFAGNLFACLADSETALLAARFFAGLPHGAYFGAAAVMATSLVGQAGRGRAVGIVMLGLTFAMLLGTPAATWIGMNWGWRVAFAAICAVCLLGASAIRLFIPSSPTISQPRASNRLQHLTDGRLWLAALVVGTGFAGMFCVLSYIASLLTAVSGLFPAQIPLALALYGLGAVCGTLIGSRAADAHLFRAISGSLVYASIILAGFSIVATWLPGALLATFLLGGIVAIGPGMQLWMMDLAGDAKTLGASLTHSAINFANALGAWMGGVALASGSGLSSLGWIGSLFGLTGLVLFLAIRKGGLRKSTSR